ncbi:MAG: TolC family protein [Acidobacteriota bacterium]
MPRACHRGPFRVVPILTVVGILAVLASPGLAAPAAPQGQQASTAQTMQLSLDRALRLALENNLDIAVIDFDRRIARENIVTQSGAFDPTINVGIPGATAAVGGVGQTAPAVGGLGFSGAKTPASSILAGADINESTGYNTQANVFQRFDFGFSYQASYNVNRQTTNSTFTSLNPSWNNTLGFAFAQPLLRGRGKESAGAQVLLARANATVSDESFRSQVNAILFNVVQAYWELVFAERNLQVAEQSLQLAQDQLGRTQAQVEVGMIAPVEETQAQVAVAQRRNDLIVARNSASNAADNLRALLKADTLPGSWETQIVATEAPEITIEAPDMDSSIQTALDSRPEIASVRAQVAARRVETNAANNALLPALDIVGGLAFNGIGGTQLLFDPEGGFPPVVIGEIPGGYSDAAGDLFSLDYPTWRLGFNFSMPIGNNAAKGAYAQATLNEDKARTDLLRVEQQTTLEVRQAVRAVTDAGELVTTTRATRELAEQQLSIEQDRFDVGMSTNFEVLQFQDDLARAQVQELRALIDYRKARAALARVTGAIAGMYGVQIQ